MLPVRESRYVVDTPSSEKPMLVELPIRVKTYDIDFVGHVNNIVYVRWLEDLRLAFLDVHLPLEPLRQRGILPIIVNTAIDYKQGIVLSDETVLGSMWVSGLKSATFFLSADFNVGGEVRCTAVQRGTFVEAPAMKPIRIPVSFREAFDKQTNA